MIYSKSDMKSGFSEKDSEISLEVVAKSLSPLKKSSISSIENYGNSFEKCIKNFEEKSLILETKRESDDLFESKRKNNFFISSCETRKKNDLNLEFIVPNLISLNFKSKQF